VASYKNKLDEDDVKLSMLTRDAKLNPPDADPGMEDSWSSNTWGSDSWSNDVWGSSGSSSDSDAGDSWSSGGSGWGSSFSWDDAGVGGGLEQSKQADTPTTEDRIFEGLAVGCKGIVTFMKELITSFKTFDSRQKLQFGKRVIFTSIPLGLVGLVLILFGKTFGLNLLVGSLLSLGCGIPIFMFGFDNIEKGIGLNPTLDSEPSEELPTEEGNDSAWSDPFSGDNLWSDTSSPKDRDSEWNFGLDTKDTKGDNDFLSSFKEDESSDEVKDLKSKKSKRYEVIDVGGKKKEETKQNTLEDYLREEEEERKQPVDKQAILDTVVEGNSLVTKSYLYEKIYDYMVTNRPDFAKESDLDGTRKFELLCTIVSEVDELLRPAKQEDTMYLVSATEKLFYIEMILHRPKWVKNVSNIVDELVALYKFSEGLGLALNDEKKNTVHGSGILVGNKILVKIMKPETAAVTVKDTYSVVESTIKGSKYKMPIVMGVGVEGDVIVRDFWDINAILITGMPRSGKSWLVQSVLAQMMMYMSPKDLQFYILDPKAETSDFKDLTMPHVRKFITKEDEMVKELSYIVNVEGPRRKKFLGDRGFKNINDFKRKHPNEDLPAIYIIIDEVVTLSRIMNKESKDEFQNLLLILVSQLPAYGIRIMMVPHVVKNDIIRKSTTDLIACRISVRGDEAHIESSTGTKPKDFNHKLYHQGDMAVKLNNDPTTFVHGAILTTTNEGNTDLFAFLTELWRKIDPESYEGSYAQQVEQGGCFGQSVWVEEEVVKQPKKRGRKPKAQQDSNKAVAKPKVVIEETKSSGVVGSSYKQLSSSQVDDLLNGDDDETAINIWD
jgi:S-DNA-T family DNA segregation ATPase FtsK/SpoIIIE